MRTPVEEAYEKLLAEPGVVFLLGGIDTGKTTFGVDLVRRATEAGIPSAIVDADIVQSTIGPPTTVGLKICREAADLTREALRKADGLGFVGSTVPKGHLLPLVTNSAKLVTRAKAAGCKLVVVDTSSLVSGIYGQSLKFFKMDLISPDFTVAFERGGELEPLVGIAQRFVPGQVIELEVSPAPASARSTSGSLSVRSSSPPTSRSGPRAGG